MKILVYLEKHHESLKRVSYELITAARNLGAEFCGVLINGSEETLKTAQEYGLSKVYLVNDPKLADYSSTAYASIVKQIASKDGFDVLLFPANSTGLELAPRVAAKFHAGYVSDCMDLAEEKGNLIAKKPVYAGKAMVKSKVDTDVKVFSLRPNVFTATKATAGSLDVVNTSVELSDKDFRAVVKSMSVNEGKMDVAEADIVVSGGRGLKGPENYNLVENLAKALGGAVGASRAVVDAGWRPHAEQVGQTGKTVSPSLYVACGISGAVQHLAGMSSSKVIVAINKDKDAPIFKIADYGLVGDLFEIMPKLTEKINAVAK